MSVVSVIFSYNRAFQLDATLRSFIFHCKDFRQIYVKIIYKAEGIHKEQYESLVKEYRKFSNIQFVTEGNFKADVISLTTPFDHVLFLVDDNIFVESFNIADCINILNTENSAIGVSLRLGLNTNYCYSLNCDQKIPEYQNLNNLFLKFRWIHSEADFAYPLELSSSVYRVNDLLEILSQIQFENPNTFEAKLDASKQILAEKYPDLISYEYSRTFCAPINKVQTVAAANRAGSNSEYSAEDLAKKYHGGLRFDIAVFIGFKPNGCHEEVDLHFVGDQKIQTETITDGPLISIVIPCYNQADLVVDALNSVLNQSYQNWECIVVNDGSPDNTSEVVRSFITKYPEKDIKLLDVKNGGLSSARNRGIEASHGEFILPFDSDDKLHQDYLKRMLQALIDNPEISFVYCNRQDFGISNDAVSAIPFDFNVLIHGNILSYCSLYRRSVWEDANGYDEALTSYEDWNFWISAAKKGHKGLFVPEFLFFYRVKEQSMYTDALERDPLLKAQIVLNHPELYTEEIIQQAKAIYNPELPLVSVITPTYNRPEMLKEAIKSVIAQDYSNIEMIIINDNGCNLENLIDRYSKQLRIKYYKNIKNIKLSASRNVGLSLAEGKYVTYLDDDDIFYPNHVSTLVSFLEKTRFKVAYTDGNKAIQKKNERGEYEVVDRINELSNDFSYEYLLVTNITPVCCVMHAKECSDTIGKFDERMHTLEDWDYWIRMSQHYEFKHLKEITCEYRQRDDGSNSTSQDQAYFRHSERIILLNNLHSLQNYEKFRDYALERLSQLNSFIFYDENGKPYLNTDLQNEEKQSTLVSVIVPTFNRKELIKRTLDSLAGQTYKNFEVLVVNDAGEDISEILELYKSQLTIRYFVNKANLGLAASRNVGLKNANGKYIAYLDDDDIYYPEHIKLLLDRLEESDYKVAYADSIRTMEEYVNGEYIEKEKFLDQSTDFDRDLLFCRNITPVLAVMHEKSCVQQVGYFREDFHSHEDWEYWIRMAEFYDFLHIPIVSSEFFQRLDNDNMTFTRKDEFNRTRIEIYETYMNAVANKKEYFNFIQKELDQLYETVKKEDGVSIIILTYKTRDLTKICIESIIKNTNENYEIIIVDNASDDGSLLLAKEFAKIHSHITIIENDKNYGFSKGNNIGAQYAKYNKLLLLNNDIEIINDNWLSSMLNVLNNDEEVAVVGAKLMFPNKLLQHAGVVVLEDLRQSIPISCCHRHYKDKDFTELQALECQAVTGACLLIKKDVYSRVNGLDEAFWNGYEDVDLCFKVRELGYKIVYEPKSISIHHESMSGKERTSKINENIKLLISKWQGKVKPDAVINKNKELQKLDNSVFKVYKKEMNGKRNQESSRGSVSIVVVSFLSEKTILKCLESVEKSLGRQDQVVIVDNASTDNTVNLVQTFIQGKNQFLLIQNKENLGFSEASNQGILATNSKYLVLLNPDTVVYGSWLDRLSDPLEKSQDIAATGPMTNYSCGLQNIVSCVDKDLIASFDRVDDISEHFEKTFDTELIETPFLIGFCLMVRRENLVDIGLLDKELFLGSDDIDLSWRLRLENLKLVICKSVFVYHEGQHSFKEVGKEFTSELGKQSTEVLYKKLKRFYGEYNIPSPSNIWEMEWFSPENPNYNSQAKIDDMDTENKNFLKLYHQVQYQDKDEAKLSIIKFLEEHPSNALALEELAIMTWNENQYEEALKLIEASIIQNPENESAFVEFIDMLLSLNLHDDAHKFLTEYLEKKPQHEDSLIRLHNVYIDKNDLSSAKNTIRKLVKLNPKKPEYQSMLESIS